MKVLDFGLAKLVERDAPEGVTSDSTATAASALGSVLYEMLAGRRPFEGSSHLLTLIAILRDAPPPLKSVRSDVPAKLERIVARSLEKRPVDRFPSANEMEKALADCRGGPAASASGVPRRSILHRPALFIPVLLALLAAAGAAVWLIVGESRVRRAREVTLPAITRLVEQETTFHPGRPGDLLGRRARPIPGPDGAAGPVRLGARELPGRPRGFPD